MDVAPITNRVVVSPVEPLTRVAKVRGPRRSARKDDEADTVVPEPPPGTGLIVDLYA